MKLACFQSWGNAGGRCWAKGEALEIRAPLCQFFEFCNQRTWKEKWQRNIFFFFPPILSWCDPLYLLGKNQRFQICRFYFQAAANREDALPWVENNPVPEGICASHAHDFPFPLFWEHFPFVLKAKSCLRSVVLQIGDSMDEHQSLVNPGSWDIPNALQGRNINFHRICSLPNASGICSLP